MSSGRPSAISSPLAEWAAMPTNGSSGKTTDSSHHQRLRSRYCVVPCCGSVATYRLAMGIFPWGSSGLFMLDGWGAIPGRNPARLPIYPSPHPNLAQNPGFPFIMKRGCRTCIPPPRATGISCVILTFNLNEMGIE